MWEGLGVWGKLGGNTELALAQLLVVEPLSGGSGFWMPGKLRELLPAERCPPRGGGPCASAQFVLHLCEPKFLHLKCRYLWKNKTAVSHPCVYVICSISLLSSCHPAGAGWASRMNETMWGMDAG